MRKDPCGYLGVEGIATVLASGAGLACSPNNYEASGLRVRRERVIGNEFREVARALILQASKVLVKTRFCF